MDSFAHIENNKFIGRTNLKAGLVKNVIALSVREVAGVGGVCRFFKGFSFKRFISSDEVKITYSLDGVIIDACILVEYGFNAADVCYRVQENVLSAAGSMLDKKIKAINVKIANVAVPFFEEEVK